MKCSKLKCQLRKQRRQSRKSNLKHSRWFKVTDKLSRFMNSKDFISFRNNFAQYMLNQANTPKVYVNNYNSPGISKPEIH